MAGNTRGKLKEHFEGIHRNFDWILHHINTSLTLISSRLVNTPDMKAVKGDAEKEEKVLQENPVYRGTKALGEGVQALDDLAKSIFNKL